ncbi:TPA: hypothetical protein RQK28_000696 [Vibrio vulnificus]|nr:hypothetical protein [Vibrio vulnificus]
MSFDYFLSEEQGEKIYLKVPVVEDGSLKEDEEGNIIFIDTEHWVELQPRGSREFSYAIRMFIEKSRQLEKVVEAAKQDVFSSEKELEDAMKRLDDIVIEFNAACIKDWDETAFKMPFSRANAKIVFARERMVHIFAQIAKAVDMSFASVLETKKG